MRTRKAVIAAILAAAALLGAGAATAGPAGASTTHTYFHG